MIEKLWGRFLDLGPQTKWDLPETFFWGLVLLFALLMAAPLALGQGLVPVPVQKARD